MSQIENVITTTFRARGSQAIAQMGQYSQGFGQVGRVINETTKMSERLNNQWRAIGTTIRYAIAGGAIFGLTRMVTQLKDVQQQLGLIQAIGQPAGGGVLSTNAVDRLGNDLQKASFRALTPIGEINDATINLLSTVQNVPQSEIPMIITDIAQAAKLAQTPVEDLTKAAATMNIAFGRPNNRRTIGEFNRQWFSLIKEAPGGISAAPQIAQQLPQLASMFALGKGPISGAESQRQMLSLVLGVLRTGSNPSTGMRGLTYLAQSIIQPTGKARGALAGIGITPQSVEKEGLYPNLIKLLNRITHTGNAKQIAAMPEDTLNALEESGGGLPGIPAAEMTRLRQMIPRIHGIRAAVILAGQLRQQGQVLSLQQDLEVMAQAQADMADQQHSLARGWQDFRKRSKLQEAVVALDTMKLQVAQAFEPILNFAASGISGLTGAAQHHRTATKAAVLGGGAMLAALGVARFMGITRFGGAGGNALARANAVQAAMSPGGVLGDAPQNPLYVVVVSQLFNPSTKVPGGGGPDPVPGKPGFWKGMGGRQKLLLGGELGAIALGSWLVGTQQGRNVLYTPVPLPNFTKKNPHNDVLEKAYASDRADRAAAFGGTSSATKKASGQAVLDINIKHPDGSKERRRVHVPVDLWSGGNVPSSRGQSGKTARKK